MIQSQNYTTRQGKDGWGACLPECIIIWVQQRAALSVSISKPQATAGQDCHNNIALSNVPERLRWASLVNGWWESPVSLLETPLSIWRPQLQRTDSKHSRLQRIICIYCYSPLHEILDKMSHSSVPVQYCSSHLVQREKAELRKVCWKSGELIV